VTTGQRSALPIPAGGCARTGPYRGGAYLPRPPGSVDVEADTHLKCAGRGSVSLK
jgi:hypothetical protein